MPDHCRKVSKKILVADDDSNFRNFLRLLLEESGYLVVEAEDGIKAMLRIMDESPDLVLLDLAMPTITGHRVTELMNSVPDIRNIPFIIISGNAMVGKTRLESIGAEAVFPKPFVKEELLEAIDSVLAIPTLEIIEEKPDAPIPSSGTDGPTPRPDGEQKHRDWFGPMRKGSPRKTIDGLRRALQQQPGSLETAGYLKLAESLIVRNFFCRVNEPRKMVPRLDPKLAEEITRFNLNPAEGFLLSQMDGQTDLDSLFFVSGMDRFHTSLLLEKLLSEGIVLLENGRVAND